MRTLLTDGISSDKRTLPDPSRDHIQGPSTAQIMLLEYGDFQCPYCGAAYPVVRVLQARLGDRLCFAFRNFPLTTIHRYAEHAAEAAEAAGAQGEFWQMHDALFENQPRLADTDIERYATELKLDSKRLMEEVQSSAYVGRVREDFRSGILCDVNGTPTFFINGIRYDGDADVDSMLAALTGVDG